MTRKEMEAKLEPSSFSYKAAGVVAYLILFTAFTVGIYVAPITPFFLFGIWGAGFVIALFAFQAKSNHRKILEEGWTGFYKGSRWKTPAGEPVTVEFGNLDGTIVDVVFEDGYRFTYGLWLLEPMEDYERLPRADFRCKSEALFKTVSKTQWKHVDGRIGVVRDARRQQAGDELAYVDFITLKTSDGVREYERNYLTPA